MSYFIIITLEYCDDASLLRLRLYFTTKSKSASFAFEREKEMTL